MGNKKEIGTYFKDQLTEKEIRPTDKVWITIEATLKKKRRKRFFIWFFLIGAISLLGLFIFWQITLTNTEETNEDAITNTNKKVSPSEENKLDAPFKTKVQTKKQKEGIIEPIKNVEPKDSLLLKAPSNSQQVKSNAYASYSKTSTQGKKEAVSSTQTSKNTSNTASSEVRVSKAGSLNEKERPRSKKETNTSKTQNQPSPVDSTELGVKEPTKATKGNQETSTIDVVSGKLLGKEVQKNKDSVMVKDTLDTKPKRAPRKKKEENEEEKETPKLLPGNWTVSVHGAPVYHGYLSNTNALLRNDSLPISNELSLGYGILVNVPLNDKVLFRFGFNKLDFKYSYENVSSRININARPDIFNPETTDLFTSGLDQNLRNEIDAGLAFDIEHKISYWEIPLEVVHAIKGKKARVDVIGGLDLYVFRNDAINLEIPNRGTFNIGSANYFKKQALGAHIGVGFRYPITKGIQFDIEPTFKYLFSSFKRDTQSLNPYYFGIYTGFTFKL